jgi:hypothetical protein
VALRNQLSHLGSLMPARRRPNHRCRPGLEALDERIAPTVSSITSNFNGTAIGAGSTVWFNSVMKVSGLGANPVTLRVDNATISSPQFSVAVPDAVITFSPAATVATTDFDSGTNTWVTTVPTGLGGNTFLDGVALPLPGGLPGGVKPVTWTADFTADTPGVTVQWQWAAAVYRSFDTDYNALNVKPVDSNRASPYQNSDHAGTPEAFRGSVVGGARGGGGSNFTGSYSATAAVVPDVAVPPPPGASLSGSVYVDNNVNGVRDASEAGIANVTIILTGTDSQGHAVSLTTTTDEAGNYSFTGLLPGTYQLFEVQPGGVDDGADTVGTVNGVPRGSLVANDTIGGITLAAGENGVHYDFGEILPS